MSKVHKNTANSTGGAFEKTIEDAIKRCGYKSTSASDFFAGMGSGVPLYCHKLKYGSNIYESRTEYDFIVYHPQKHPNGLVIEVKWQQVPGTADEKFPFLVLNIQNKYPFKTVLILDGGGYRIGAEKWVRLQVGSNLLHVFNFTEFMIWINNGNL